MPVCLRGYTGHFPIALTTVDSEINESRNPKEYQGRQFMQIKKSDCPVSTRGREASAVPAVGIHENGQAFFNSKAIEQYIGTDKKYIAAGIDGRTVTLQFVASLPKNYTEADVFSIKYNDKVKGAYASLTSLWKHEAVGYDYKNSGNQTFVITAGDKAKAKISFELPAGALTPKPKATRTKKVKTAPAPEQPDTKSLDEITL